MQEQPANGSKHHSNHPAKDAESALFKRRPRLRRRIRHKAWDEWLRATDVIIGRQRRFPDFIICGGMRCGTTALFSYLASHPQLSPSRRKEVHYFDLHYDRGNAWYKRQFRIEKAASADGGRLFFESSPYYMFEPRVAARIHATVPAVKLIFLLRDPIDRAISHYQKNLRDNREWLALSEALDSEEDRLAGEEEKLLANPHYYSPKHQYFSYKARGRYAALLKRFEHFFESDQMLIIRSSSLFEQPKQTLARVCDFVGVTRWHPNQFPVINQSRIKTMLPEQLRAKLEADFEPDEQDLEQLIGWRSADWPCKL